MISERTHSERTHSERMFHLTGAVCSLHSGRVALEGEPGQGNPFPVPLQWKSDPLLSLQTHHRAQLSGEVMYY